MMKKGDCVWKNTQSPFLDWCLLKIMITYLNHICMFATNKKKKWEKEEM